MSINFCEKIWAILSIYQNILKGQIPERTAELPDGTLHIICAAGGRSMQACEFLSAQGRDTVNIAGGTKGWVASGRAVESGSADA